MEQGTFKKIKRAAISVIAALSIASAGNGAYQEYLREPISIIRAELPEPEAESFEQAEQSVEPEAEPSEQAEQSAESKTQTLPTAELLIDLNSASSEELQKLSGIGPAKAQLIIEYREFTGGFVCTEEIMEVRGIGPGIFERIKDNIYVSTGET